jgi:hypothetical protein
VNLPEFRALLAEFALAHPERPLSDVTVVEFAAWQAERSPTGRNPSTPPRMQPMPPLVPDHFFQAEGSPRCDLCKDTGWRRSVERGRKVPCECGARGVLANTEALALVRIPAGNPSAGNINNCALANMAAEADCQMCKGACPDRNRFVTELARGHKPR